MNSKQVILPDNLSINDSIILGININSDCSKKVNITVSIKINYPKELYLNFVFKDVREYSFFWNNNYNFYFIDSYKLLFKDNFYYCSFDPADENISFSKDDGDYVICNNIELLSTNNSNFENLRKIEFNTANQ